MERKKRMKPVTVLKVQKYLQSIIDAIDQGKNISLDRMAREHNLSGSVGTALVRMGWIVEQEMKGDYKIQPEKFQVSNEKAAKFVLEHVRVHNLELAEKKKGNDIHHSGGVPEINVVGGNKPSDEHFKLDGEIGHELKFKGRTSGDLAGILERALAGVVNQKQMNIFEGAKNIHEERMGVAKSIASGVYGSLQINASQIASLRKGVIEDINSMIVFATADLIKQVTNFKPSGE